MAIDVDRERARTPGVGDAHHLNAAGAALPSARTLAATLEHLHLESRMGGYEASGAVRERLEAVYALAARLIRAEPDEIALTESATVGWRRIVDALRLGRGDRVLVSRSGYVSCALQLLALERDRGVVVELLPNGADGAIDVDALRDALDAGPAALLALTHVPTSSGLCEPVAQAGRLARAAGVTDLLDATQSVGHLPVDVAQIGCDALVTTGRKYLRGPRGTALLYVRRALLQRLSPVAPDVRGATWTADRDWTLDPGARRLETWEASHALRLGLGVALAEADALGIDAIAAHLVERGATLRGALAAIPGVVVTDPPAAHGAIVTFAVEGREPRDVAATLAERAVHVVAVPAAHGQWDLAGRGLAAVVRAAPHVYSSDADLEALVEGVAALAGASRNGPRPAPPGPPGPPVERADVVVVGLGLTGCAAAASLAGRGLRVIGLERRRFADGSDELAATGDLQALRRLARERGARLREAEPLVAWAPDGDGVIVETVMGRIAADRLVVCAGAATAALLRGPTGLADLPAEAPEVAQVVGCLTPEAAVALALGSGAAAPRRAR
jgi:selenocysteine lyase/cysteine desulfurase